MRAVAILGPKTKRSDLAPFQRADLKAHIVQGRAPEAGFDAVLILGGDGTVHHQLPKLVETQLPLLVVPGGSGNDFTRSLGLHTTRKAIKAWEQFCRGAANVRQFDLGVITPLSAIELSPASTRNQKLETRNSTLFTCIASVGLDSETTRRANRLPASVRARGGYVFSALVEIARWEPLGITLSTDAITLSEPATFVAVGNAPTYGDGMKMTPRAQLEDGLLDVCFVRRTSKRRLLTFFPTVFFGRHLTLPEVEYIQTPSVRIDTERPMDVYADGEYVCKTPVEISVIPKTLRVICLS